jgi:hypothetical protein
MHKGDENKQPIFREAMIAECLMKWSVYAVSLILWHRIMTAILRLVCFHGSMRTSRHNINPFRAEIYLAKKKKKRSFIRIGSISIVTYWPT